MTPFLNKCWSLQGKTPEIVLTVVAGSLVIFGVIVLLAVYTMSYRRI